jgi:nucleoside-diphosphate-sugar epimerase
VATAWAYLPDLAQTFVQVAQKRAQLPQFEVLHFAGHSLTARQWVEVLTPLAQTRGWVQANTSVRYKVLPWAIIRLGGLVVPAWAALAEMRYLWLTPHRLANDRLVQLLGAEPHTPLPQAAARALDDLGWAPSLVRQSAVLQNPAH